MPSSSSFSSSSSEYCFFPECVGNACANLTNWFLQGVDEIDTDNGALYVRCVSFPATDTQQVEIYKDETYFNLVAIGQISSIVATTIIIEERNSSGISGAVDWDSTLLDFSYSATLFCTDFSSSSSTSSVDSSSSSSPTSESESSSSSQCCASVFCEGTACANFSTWSLSGMADRNTTNCTIYVGLETAGAIQQVRFYKEATLTNLTAVGQRTGAGIITLIEQNNSGLTGTVIYDGTLLPYPTTLTLSCSEFSSSSSFGISSSSSIDSSSSSSIDYSASTVSYSETSSSSSVDSSSSSSSAGYSSSSDSSTSESSSSSPTSVSESSSSSIDSSSTSSESIGNVSTSSSSSLEVWNQAKPLILGISSAADPNNKNRIAQTISIFNNTYSIGKIYCYLYEARGIDDNYQIRLSINDCNNDGTPDTELFITSILASEVDHDGWYPFEFDLEDQVTPSNTFLSFVLRHDGNEDNYVLWAYDQENPDDTTIAWTSSDAATWEIFPNAVMALKVVGNFNPFDSEDNTISTPPTTEPSEIIDPIIDGEIEYRDLICSFVVDSSGSMGLTDRFNNRRDLVNSLVSSFQIDYPSDVQFDFFGFGGSEVDLDSITTGLGRYESLNFDLSVPSRTTYVFAVAGANASVGSVYSSNDAEFTVQYAIHRGETELITFGTNPPIDSGTLTLVSGTGNATIEFGSVVKVSIDDGMIAYGFKDLENTHIYNIGELLIDNVLLSDVDEKNWQLFNPSSEYPTLTEDLNGPGDTASIDIKASANLVSRKLLNNLTIKEADIVDAIEVGDVVVNVVDASEFNVGDIIDIVSGTAVNLGRTIQSISNDTIVFSPSAKRHITSHSQSGSIVQTSTFNRLKNIDGSTANLFIRDVSVTQNITFYLQNLNGYYIEWDFEPFVEWISNNIYWLGDTAILPVELKELDGTPFPDGTKVEFLVDVQPDIVTDNLAEATSVSQTSSVGDTKVYVDSLDGYSREQIIDITDKDGNVQTTEIVAIGTDDIGPYIEISEPLLFEVSTDSASTISPNEANEAVLPTGAILASEIAIVDVTPIVNDKSLDTALLKPYDITPVPPSTPYEDLNTDKDFMQKQTIDMPTIDGNVVVRILPIAEDILETIADKQKDLDRLQRVSPVSDVLSQLELNNGDFETVAPVAITTQGVPSIEVSAGDDYTIETPVFTLNGLAKSAMVSTATELTEKNFGDIRIPGVSNPSLLSKTYTIYPSAELIGDNNNTLAKLYLESFEIDFVPPVYIDSSFPDSPQVHYYLVDPAAEGCFPAAGKEFVRGVFAADVGFTVDYNITDEFILANNKTVTITIYSNQVVDLDTAAEGVVFGASDTEQFVNLEQAPVTVVQDDGTVVAVTNSSAIDLWRNTAQNNPFESVIEGTGETDDDLPVDAGEASHADNVVGQYASLVGGSLTQEDTESVNLFYQDPLQWTLAKQYDQYVYEIPIVNGKASITVPESGVVALLMIEASVPFGENGTSEQIRSDLVFVSNPINIGDISPGSIIPAENEIYEMGVNIEFRDGSTTVADNTTVNFSLETNAEPSTSVTDNGWAGGVFVGPHAPIPTETPDPAADVICPPTEDETVVVEVFHSSGYIRKVNRRIVWYGRLDQEDVTETFIFFASDSVSTTWSDGSTVGGASVISDLDDAFNPTGIYVGEDGVIKLQGEGQINGLPRPVRAFGAIPAKSTWEGGKIELFAEGFNKNLGHKQPLGIGEKLKEPWDKKLNAVTSYKQDNGTFRRGEIANGRPFLSAGGGLVIPKPLVTYQEPLGITMSIESSFIRNGVSAPIVVADVTWKGQPLRNDLILNEGSDFETTIQFPFPTVTFQSGICETSNSTDGDTPSMIDTRNTIDGCFEIAQHPSGKLTTYAQETGLTRTDIYIDGSDQHKHTTVVDADGNGATTSMIVIGGVVSSHTHSIVDFEIQETDGHTHSLRCVAVTQLKPTDDIATDLVINGYVIYDPTNASPYGSEPSVDGANRMMFASQNLPSGSILEKTLVTKIDIGNDLNSGSPIFTVDYPVLGETSEADITAPTFYTASSIEDTLRGFDIQVSAKFAEYTYLDGGGLEVTVPEEIVEDGSRITVEFIPFKPEGSAEEGTDVGYPVMAAGLKREYMVLKAKISIGAEGYFTETTLEINIVSIAQWFPSVKHLVPSLTTDSQYISEAVDEFGYFGSSQVHDAVKKAAEQLVQYQTDDPKYATYKKIIFLLSDGDENTSENSLSQAIDAVNFINGKNEVPVIPVQLGQVHSSDSVLLEKYASGTSGSVFYLNDDEISTIQDVANDIVSGNNLEINSTLLIGSIVFADENIPSITILDGAVVPTGSSVSYRLRTSADGITFTDWTEFIDAAIPYEHDQSIGSLQKYLEYEILIEGNSTFDTPVINGGINVSYFNPKDFIIFFQPVALNLTDDEYLSSIHVTHESEIPETSTVEYLITQSQSLEIDDYIRVIPDQHTIIPTRFNELLNTNDFKTYTASNRRWHTGATIDVWRISADTPQGALIAPSEYSSNSQDGTITFLSAQDANDVLFVDVYFDSSFRLAARIKNFGEDAAVIHHIGVEYNISKRIPRSRNGTIINIPISSRLPT